MGGREVVGRVLEREREREARRIGRYEDRVEWRELVEFNSVMSGSRGVASVCCNKGTTGHSTNS